MCEFACGIFLIKNWLNRVSKPKFELKILCTIMFLNYEVSILPIKRHDYK